MEVHILWVVPHLLRVYTLNVLIIISPHFHFSPASSQPLAIKMWPLCLKYLHSWRASCRPPHRTVLTLGQRGSAFPPLLVDTLAAYLEDCNLLVLIARNITSSSYHCIIIVSPGRDKGQKPVNIWATPQKAGCNSFCREQNRGLEFLWRVLTSSLQIKSHWSRVHVELS